MYRFCNVGMGDDGPSPFGCIPDEYGWSCREGRIPQNEIIRHFRDGEVGMQEVFSEEVPRSLVDRVSGLQRGGI